MTQLAWLMFVVLPVHWSVQTCLPTLVQKLRQAILKAHASQRRQSCMMFFDREQAWPGICKSQCLQGRSSRLQAFLLRSHLQVLVVCTFLKLMGLQVKLANGFRSQTCFPEIQPTDGKLEGTGGGNSILEHKNDMG